MAGEGGRGSAGPAERDIAVSPAAARAALADRMRDAALVGGAVEAAFRAVPRHLFVPELPPEQAYQDEAFVIKYDTDGLPVSSSSQPAMMAIMLEQLGLSQGQRVLEIGTGTGYNAALIAHIIGDQRAVVTVDIDPELVERARASLAIAGYGGVTAACADGGLGVAGHAPYDRIILTVGAWDIAPQWLAQLAPGGRLVLPLSVRGIQLSVAFERADGCWVSRSVFRCGFIKMVGALSGPESFVPVGPQPGLLAETDDGRRLDTLALHEALTGTVTDVPTGLRSASLAEAGDLDLWLTLTEPRLLRLTLLGAQPGRAGRPRPMPMGGLALATDQAGQLGVATILPERPEPGSVLAVAAADPAARIGPADGDEADADDELPGRDEAAAEDPLTAQAGPTARSGMVIRGYGPRGAELAEYLAERAQDWHSLGRPGATRLRLAVYPAGRPAVAMPGTISIDREHVRIAVSWARLT